MRDTLKIQDDIHFGHQHTHADLIVVICQELLATVAPLATADGLKDAEACMRGGLAEEAIYGQQR